MPYWDEELITLAERRCAVGGTVYSLSIVVGDWDSHNGHIYLRYVRGGEFDDITTFALVAKTFVKAVDFGNRAGRDIYIVNGAWEIPPELLDLVAENPFTEAECLTTLPGLAVRLYWGAFEAPAVQDLADTLFAG